MDVDISKYPVMINGTKLDPQPLADGGLIWSDQDVQSANSGRMEDGSMDMEVVAKKVKLQFKFPATTTAKVSAILKLIDDTYFNVEYFDPKLNERATKKFYKGDRTVTWYSFTTAYKYKELSFNVIEK